MLCIVFYLNLPLKFVVKYLFFIFFKYPWVPVDIREYKRIIWVPT